MFRKILFSSSLILVSASAFSLDALDPVDLKEEAYTEDQYEDFDEGYTEESILERHYEINEHGEDISFHFIDGKFVILVDLSEKESAPQILIDPETSYLTVNFDDETEFVAQTFGGKVSAEVSVEEKALMITVELSTGPLEVPVKYKNNIEDLEIFSSQAQEVKIETKEEL